VHGGVPGMLVALISSAWLAATATLAVRAARRRRFVQHREWALRHVAIGASVILQRWLIIASVIATMQGVLPQVSYETGVAMFGHLAFASLLICIVTVEGIIMRSRRAPVSDPAKAVHESPLCDK
jgi:membrane-anchored protein YejM (alkaline phosphatase superfamily)